MSILSYFLNIYIPKRALKRHKKELNSRHLGDISCNVSVQFFFWLPFNTDNWTAIAFRLPIIHTTWKPIHQFQLTIIIKRSANFLIEAHETYVYTYSISVLIAHYCTLLTMIILPQLLKLMFLSARRAQIV